MSDADLYHLALTEYRGGQARPELVSKAYVLAAGSNNPKGEEIEYVKLRVAELKAERRVDVAKSAVASAVSSIEPHIAPAASAAKRLFLWLIKISFGLVAIWLFAAAAFGSAADFSPVQHIALIVGGLFCAALAFTIPTRRKTS